jgi:hypothetical protein
VAAAAAPHDDADAARAISLLLISAVALFALAFRLANKDWHLWRDVRLTLEGAFDRVPDLADLWSYRRSRTNVTGRRRRRRPPLDPVNPTTVRCFSRRPRAELQERAVIVVDDHLRIACRQDLPALHEGLR